MTSPARLLMPSVRADAGGRLPSVTGPAIDAAIRTGVGGFLIFGGTRESVPDFIDTLRRLVDYPLLFASDLERGAGQQVDGLTRLPPPLALGSLGDVEATRTAGLLTASEAMTMGLDLLFGPVADLDIEPRNPIVGTRSFGAKPHAVSDQVRSWVQGCLEGGCAPCPKHFPGHGRTVADSHSELPIIDANRTELEADLAPFRAAIRAGTPAIMSGHIIAAVLDPKSPATFSHRIVQRLARDELRFDGVIVSDSLQMEGAAVHSGRRSPAVAALAAGCDILLEPADAATSAAHVESALATDRALHRALLASLERREALIQRIRGIRESVAAGPSPEWASDLAEQTIAPLRGSPEIAGSVRVAMIDDDAEAPYPLPSRTEFARTLAGRGIEDGGSDHTVIALISDPRAYKGRSELSSTTLESVHAHLQRDPDALIVLFGHPRLADQLPDARHILGAWGGDPNMQRAAANWLANNNAE